MDMNFSMDGLNELIGSLEASKRKEDEKKNFNASEKMSNFTTIIEGVARKYGSKWVEEEDLRQDLWCRVLTLINDCGGIENTDESLVASVCYNKAVDAYRYYRRRYDSKAEYIEGSDTDDREIDLHEKRDNRAESLYSEKFVRGYDLVLIKETIDIFPIGSKERKYAVLKLVNHGVIDFGSLDEMDQIIFEIPEREDEESYIHSLGYKSHCPGSWTDKKRSMKKAILDFLNE